MFVYTYADQTCTDDFSVIDQDTGLLVGSLVQGDFTVAIYDPNGSNRSDGTDAVTWSIVEKFAGSGYYLIDFTPDLQGDWVFSVIHSTYFPWGKSANYRVVSTSYYGTGGSGAGGTVSTDDLLAFILGLY
jgi:hypothetical protein